MAGEIWAADYGSLVLGKWNDIVLGSLWCFDLLEPLYSKSYHITVIPNTLQKEKKNQDPSRYSFKCVVKIVQKKTKTCPNA